MFTWQGRVCMATDGTAAGQVHMYEFLPFVFMPRIHFGKAEVAYRHHRFA